MEKVSCLSVPDLASTIVATSDKPWLLQSYLSPFLLKEQFVRGRTWALRVLES